MLLGSLFDFGGKLLDRFFPDAEKRREAEAEFLKMAAESEFKQVLAQLEINAREATHPSVWVAGWRPFFGWVGGCGFGYATIIQPMLAWYGSSKGWPAPPQLNQDLLWVVITGLLGIGGLRTFEKTQKVTK
jgi:hypothetical protein